MAAQGIISEKDRPTSVGDILSHPHTAYRFHLDVTPFRVTYKYYDGPIIMKPLSSGQHFRILIKGAIFRARNFND